MDDIPYISPADAKIRKLIDLSMLLEIQLPPAENMRPALFGNTEVNPNDYHDLESAFAALRKHVVPDLKKFAEICETPNRQHTSGNTANENQALNRLYEESAFDIRQALWNLEYILDDINAKSAPAPEDKKKKRKKKEKKPDTSTAEAAGQAITLKNTLNDIYWLLSDHDVSDTFRVMSDHNEMAHPVRWTELASIAPPLNDAERSTLAKLETHATHMQQMWMDMRQVLLSDPVCQQALEKEECTVDMLDSIILNAARRVHHVQAHHTSHMSHLIKMREVRHKHDHEHLLNGEAKALAEQCGDALTHVYNNIDRHLQDELKAGSITPAEQKRTQHVLLKLNATIDDISKVWLLLEEQRTQDILKKCNAAAYKNGGAAKT